MNMNESITNVTMTKVCNIKPVKDSTESKQVTLAVKYDGLTMGDVFAKALRTDIIAWQNGPGRKGYDKLIDKSTVNVNAAKPGTMTVDPETAMIAKLVAMGSDEERTAYLQNMAKMVKRLDEPEVKIRKVEPEVEEETVRVTST